MYKKLIVLGLIIVLISLIATIVCALGAPQTFSDHRNSLDSAVQPDEVIKNYDKELQVADWTKMLGSVKATFYLNHRGVMK